MRTNTLRADSYPRGKRGGKHSPDSATLAVEKLLHDAAADVEKGREFWIGLAGSSAALHRASREVLNRHN